MRLIRDDDGSATLVGVWAIAALTVVVILVVYVGAAVVARHRVQSAADLGALAGATALQSGEDACDRVTEIATAQKVGVRVTNCETIDDDVLVTMTLDVALGRFGIRTATAKARAGPVD